jgi:hypothetical protein
LKGNGVLLNLPFRTLLFHYGEYNGEEGFTPLPGDSLESEISFEVISNNRSCISILTVPGHVITENPRPLELFPIIPNPVVSDRFSIQIDLGEKSEIALDLIAPDGRLISRLYNHLELERGRYYRLFTTTGLAPGEYFLVLRSGNLQSMQKLVVLK